MERNTDATDANPNIQCESRSLRVCKFRSGSWFSPSCNFSVKPLNAALVPAAAVRQPHVWTLENRAQRQEEDCNEDGLPWKGAKGESEGNSANVALHFFCSCLTSVWPVPWANLCG